MSLYKVTSETKTEISPGKNIVIQDVVPPTRAEVEAAIVENPEAAVSCGISARQWLQMLSDVGCIQSGDTATILLQQAEDAIDNLDKLTARYSKLQTAHQHAGKALARESCSANRRGDMALAYGLSARCEVEGLAVNMFEWLEQAAKREMCLWQTIRNLVASDLVQS